MRTRTKVLFVGQLPPPHHGVAVMNQMILNSGLLRDAFEFDVVNLSTSSSISNIGKNSLSKYFKLIGILLKVKWKLLFGRPDVCYITLSPTGSAFFKDSLVLLLFKILGRNIIIHFHGKGVEPWVRSKPNWVRRYYRWLLQNTHLVLLGDSLIADVKLVYDVEPTIINNGIPDLQYPPSKAKEGTHFSILFLSNLMRSKGIFDCLKACSLLKHVHVPFTLNIIGDAGDVSFDEVQAFIHQNDLTENVEILGPKYGEEKIKYLAETDVLVFPTLNEAWGLVVLEAMQAELPVIATDEGSLPDIISDGVNGFIVEKENPQQIADKLQILVNKPDLARSMGLASRARYMSSFTSDIFEHRVYDLFNRVAS